MRIVAAFVMVYFGPALVVMLIGLAICGTLDVKACFGPLSSDRSEQEMEADYF